MVRPPFNVFVFFKFAGKS